MYTPNQILTGLKNPKVGIFELLKNSQQEESD
jgi:hypothetical protein